MKPLKYYARYIFAAIFAVAAIFSYSQAHAQTFLVGTGTPGLTYDRQFDEWRKFCSSELVMDKTKSNGAVKNAEMLIANEINGGYVQADVLFMMAKNQDLSNIKTLAVMHKEQLQFIVKSEPVKIGGTMGFGGKEIAITDLNQIGGMKVAASGGALWTAKQVRLDSEIAYNIMEVADPKQAIAALDAKGDAHADVALVVGGAPVDYLKTLNKGYRVLRIPEVIQKKIAGVYLPDRVTYNNMTDSAGVQTVAVQSLFVTREYKTAKMQNALASLRGCLLDKLDEIKETTGTSPSWQTITAEAQSQSKWPLYKLPEVIRTSVQVPTQAPAKRR